MKNLLLALFLTTLGTTIQAQTLDLCGIGSNQISVSAAQFQESTTLVFCNTEYVVKSFDVKFEVTGNPYYAAHSNNANFTSDMVANFGNRVPGLPVQLTIHLDLAGEGSSAWDKEYMITVMD